MSSILFRPTCEKCGTVIWDHIDCKTFSETVDRFSTRHYCIEPYQCRECGAIFDSVVMPTRLPFDNSRHNNFWEEV